MIIGYLIAFVVVIIDIISKVIVMNNMQLGNVIEVIPGFIKFRYVLNTGMAFSLFDNATGALFVVSFAATIGFGYLVFRYSDYLKRKTLSIALAFMLGGTIGNLIDRFLTMIGLRKGVVDFIELWIGKVNIIGNSTFNLADAFLVVGCILLIIDLLILESVKTYNREKQLKELENNGTEDNSR